MAAQPEQFLYHEAPSPGVRVVRFVRPEYRTEIYDAEPVTNSTLFRAIHEAALADLNPDETVVLNLGLLEWFPSMFYTMLLAVRQAVESQGASLVICCLTPVVQEGFELFRGFSLFQVTETEGRAVAEGKK